MLLAHRVYPRVVEDEELDESKLSDDVVDHKKKLLWALLTPSFGGVFTPQDFIELKEIANGIHFRRLQVFTRTSIRRSLRPTYPMMN